MKILERIIEVCIIILNLISGLAIYAIGFWVALEMLGPDIYDDWRSILVLVGIMNICYYINMKLFYDKFNIPKKSPKARDTNEYL